MYLRAIFQVQDPGGLYLEGRFNGGFFALLVWGAYIWRGLFSEFYGNLFECEASSLIFNGDNNNNNNNNNNKSKTLRERSCIISAHFTNVRN